MLHFKHFVIVIIFDQCFKAPLLIERMKSNYTTLLLSCSSRSIMFFIPFAPSALKKNMFYNTMTQAIIFYFELLQTSFLPIKAIDKASVSWIELFILNWLCLYSLWDLFFSCSCLLFHLCLVLKYNQQVLRLFCLL